MSSGTAKISQRCIRTVFLAAVLAMALPNCVNLTPPWAGKTGTGGAGGAAAGGAGGRAGSGGQTINADSGSPDHPDGTIDVNLQNDGAGAADGADVPLGGNGGSMLDAGIDRPALGGAGGAGAQGGSGGIAPGTGGQVASGGNGAGGAIPVDGGSVCVGRTIPDAGTGISQGLLAYYPCDETSGSTLADKSGNSNNATLVTGTGGSGGGYTFTAGKVGSGAVAFTTAQKGYATLPSGLLSNACDVTIATWVYVKTAVNWQRVFDFGKDTTTYMFLAPRSGRSSAVRFSITVNGNNNEQGLDGTAELPVGTWTHVAVVLGASGGSLYVNGALVGSNANLTLRPADLGTLPNYYLGHSQFPDPTFDGSIDDFRIYTRALAAPEVQTLATM